MPKSLRDRCKEFNHTLTQNAILRQGSPVDDIMAFVLSERGRSSDDKLDHTAPLCLYFVSEVEREEFIEIIRQAKPGMMMKKMP